MTTKRYKVRNTHCNCHPETCCHLDYEVVLGDTVIVRGMRLEELEQLVHFANIGKNVKEGG